jgi:hypothetical protein
MISSGSSLAEDIRYGLAHWEGLTRFLDDGRLELDTNPVENAIRPICLTRACPQLVDSQEYSGVIHEVSADSELTDAPLCPSGRSMGQDQGYFAGA